MRRPRLHGSLYLISSTHRNKQGRKLSFETFHRPQSLPTKKLTFDSTSTSGESERPLDPSDQILPWQQTGEQLGRNPGEKGSDARRIALGSEALRARLVDKGGQSLESAVLVELGDPIGDGGVGDSPDGVVGMVELEEEDSLRSGVAQVLRALNGR